MVRPEHFALIEKLQPYHSGGSTPFAGGPRPTALSVIQWFNNVDKHEVVHTRFMTPTYFSIVPNPRVREMEYRFGPPYVLENDAELYAVRFVDDAEVKVDILLNVEVCFGPPKYTYINVYLLQNFGQRIRDIVSDFRKITPELQS